MHHFFTCIHNNMVSLVLSNFSPPTLDSSPLHISKKINVISSVFVKQHDDISQSVVASTCFKKPHNTLITNSRGSSDGSPSKEQTPTEIKTPTVMDINQISKILPHRYPFLLVDRVLELTPGVSAVGIKNVTMNDSFFLGHFPDRPIMPGVLMLEALAQLGALVMIDLGGGSSDNLAMTGADNVRFRRMVVPGDTLVLRVNIIKYQSRFKFGKMEGNAYVGDEVACECNISAVI